MQAVILAAGRGTRMGALTETVPKPLLEVCGKTLLEYQFDALPEEIDEVIVVVGYMGSVIQQKYGGFYKERKIFYVEQDVLDGTAGALWRAKDLLHDRFVVMMSDDIFAREDIEKCIDMTDGWTELVGEVEDMKWGGNVEFDSQHRIQSITEGKHSGRGHIGTNFFVLDTRLFESELVPKAEGSPEYGLPQTIIKASAEQGVPFYAVIAKQWIQISDPEDLKKAEEILEDRV